MKRYTDATKHTYEPPSCPKCGSLGIPQWIDVTTSRDYPVRYYTPGRHSCRGENCINNPDGRPGYTEAVEE